MIEPLVRAPGDPAGRPPPAPLLQRGFAFLIDLWLVVSINLIAGARWGHEIRPLSRQLNGLPACAMMIFTPGSWLLSESLFGKTAGKFFVGLEVRSLRCAGLEFGQGPQAQSREALRSPHFRIGNPGCPALEPASAVGWRSLGKNDGRANERVYQVESRPPGNDLREVDCVLS